MGITSTVRFKIAVVTLMFLIGITPINGQEWAIKNNIFYDATTTPNLGVELRLSNKWTAGLNGAINPWTFSNNRKLKHFLVSPQGRYWLCESFQGHFVGMNAAYVHYNVSDIHFPFSLYKGVKDSRRQGDLVAAGGSWGYTWLVAPRWSIEVEAGADLGYAWSKAYDNAKCGTYRGPDNKFIVLPRLALNVVFHGKAEKKNCRPVIYEPVIVPDTPKVELPVFVPVVASVEDNTGKAGELQRSNPVLQHMSQYRPYDSSRILRKEKGALYVYFPLDKWTLRHDFRSNAATLDTIVSITRQIMADSTSSVRLIQIVGLASPEGPVKRNTLLAGKRAEALCEYIKANVDVGDIQFEMCNGGEAWTELRDQIADSDIEGREQLLDIIDTEKDPDLRERKMKRLNGGRTYRYLKENVLSDQRNSGYIRVYYDYVPDSAAAVINTASGLLRQERYDEALKMLQTVKDDERAQNALGVALYMTGRREEALTHFRKAAEAGNEEAKRNLEQIRL